MITFDHDKLSRRTENPQLIATDFCSCFNSMKGLFLLSKVNADHDIVTNSSTVHAVLDPAHESIQHSISTPVS